MSRATLVESPIRGSRVKSASSLPLPRLFLILDVTPVAFLKYLTTLHNTIPLRAPLLSVFRFFFFFFSFFFGFFRQRSVDAPCAFSTTRLRHAFVRSDRRRSIFARSRTTRVRVDSRVLLGTFEQNLNRSIDSRGARIESERVERSDRSVYNRRGVFTTGKKIRAAQRRDDATVRRVPVDSRRIDWIIAIIARDLAFLRTQRF